MYVIKKLRLNKFQPRPIVSNRALFVAMGKKPATIESKDTSDCFDTPSVEGATKTKILGLASQIASKAIEMRETEGAATALKLTSRDI